MDANKVKAEYKDGILSTPYNLDVNEFNELQHAAEDNRAIATITQTNQGNIICKLILKG